MPRRDRSPIAAALTYLSAVRLLLNSTERFVYPFLPTIARGLGIDLTQAGLLLSARAVGAFSAPLTVATAGRDRRHRRLVFAALGLFGAGVLLAVVPGHFAVALLGFAILGAARPAFDAAAQAYLAERTPYHRRGRILAVLELTYAGGLLVGAPLAGWLISRGDWRTPFLAAFGASVLTAATVARVLERTGPDEGHGAERLRLDRRSVSLLLVLVLLATGAELTQVVMGAWFEDSFGLTLLALGGAAMVIGAGEFVGELVPLAIADRIGKRRMAAAGLVISSGAFLVLPTTSTIGPGLAALTVALLGFEIAIVAAIPIVSEAQPQARSRFLALGAVAMFGGRAISAALGPVLFERVGITGNALASAASHGLALLLLWFLVREPEDGAAALR